MKNILPILVIASFLMAACGGKNAQPSSEPAALQTTDPASPLSANAGNEFKIVLESNASTGYHWEIVGELDKSIVEFVSRDYQGSEPVMPGSGGKDVWTFKAVSAGKTEITLGYYPPSNNPVTPQQTMTFTVTVK